MPTPVQLEEGTKALERALSQGLPYPEVVERVADAIRLAPRSAPGRPLERPDDQALAMAEMRDGASMRSVQRKYKLGNATVQRLKRQLESQVLG